MRLNVIGNGFGLYHGLPSLYYYFGCFLAKIMWIRTIVVIDIE